MGHALNGSIQDVLVRWHRMRGLRHALAAGLRPRGDLDPERRREAAASPRARRGRSSAATRSSSGRGAGSTRPAARSWASTGASARRSTTRASASRWTTAYVEAVMTFFVRLWEAGWIYRANRIVNWCPHHETAISDLEVEHVEMDDTLYHAALPVRRRRRRDHDRDRASRDDPRRRRGRGAPEDERYRDAVGREVVVPVVERRVPVIADARVEPDFGTGALKVTPGHDPMDFEHRPRPRARDADRDRPGRADDRRGLRGAHPGRGRRAGSSRGSRSAG